MDLDPDVVASPVVPFQPSAYLRVTPIAHRATPLGMGFGRTRFASPADAFKLVYIAEDLATSIAEAVIRDRFEGAAARELTTGELSGWGVAEVGTRAPLRLIDMRTAGCFLLGVSTDITGAKAQDEAREFSQAVYNQTDLDGILHLSRLTRRTCLAIYDRAAGIKLNAGLATSWRRWQRWFLRSQRFGSCSFSALVSGIKRYPLSDLPTRM